MMFADEIWMQIISSDFGSIRPLSDTCEHLRALVAMNKDRLVDHHRIVRKHKLTSGVLTSSRLPNGRFVGTSSFVGEWAEYKLTYDDGALTHVRGTRDIDGECELFMEYANGITFDLMESSPDLRAVVTVPRVDCDGNKWTNIRICADGRKFIVTADEERIKMNRVSIYDAMGLRAWWNVHGECVMSAFGGAKGESKAWIEEFLPLPGLHNHHDASRRSG